MAGALEGYKVIDLTTMIAGPFATMLLGDQGADVIKVEIRGRGDHVRATANRQGGFSASFLNNNRNKRSITLDLKQPEGRDVLHRLAASADVLVQNFRPGVVERLGIGEAEIRAVAPKLIYVSMSGFGDQGPYVHKPVYDPIIQAVCGLASVQGGGDNLRPRLVRTVVPDKVTALTASQAITAALLVRERTGEGQHITLSMLGAMVQFLWSTDMGGQTFVEQPFPQTGVSAFNDLIYTTADGHMAVSIMTDKQWAGLTRALEQSDWLEDPRFTSPALRDQYFDERVALTQSVLETRGNDYWLERLDAEGVACAPVLTRTELIEHPQVVASEVIHQADHPVAGPVRQARHAARFSATPATSHAPAPGLGQNTDEILEELGLNETEIAALRTAGIAGEEA
ncbi:MAG: CoA transferase [Rhodospirillaceae bacterium]|jgi:crotonobetainyl-CoA:carnitine CoA-transferase CaiB-like acyl-CoA transferase|nr:CoA transferase [Rhodospirillaceae bacterium]MBT5193394.1 CoA transferase [Rhodospirillaceae bacterium]MBT5896135.1 CoA transferase [Rhodospirillaceae bacterium]MBT6426527.1 CoA transferase [Rhodospirillaceae bacterium]